MTILCVQEERRQPGNQICKVSLHLLKTDKLIYIYMNKGLLRELEDKHYKKWRYRDLRDEDEVELEDALLPEMDENHVESMK